MDYANYKNDQRKYPVSADTLDFIQEQIKFIMKLTGVAGKRVILKDCTAAEDGLVIIDGELYKLERGYPSSYITINSTSETITAKGVVYNDARVRTYARYISYPAGYPASDFVKVNNLTELTSLLKEHINSHGHVPKGTVIDWYGEAAFDNIPYGWVPCGGFFETSGGVFQGQGSIPDTIIAEQNKWKQYYSSIELKVIGYQGPNNSYLLITKVGDMEIPNLSGRFIVGKGYSGDTGIGAYGDYNQTGGKNTVQLKESNLPEHTHDIKTISGKTEYKGIDVAGSYDVVTKVESSDSTTQKRERDATPHENRPPYFALYKLIKVI